jgi:glycolate oxidase FAD binding subunit
MTAEAVHTRAPAGEDELADALAAASGPVRIRGGGTKLAWAPPARPPALELSTAQLDALVAHNPGDMTAILEAGMPLARAQEAFAAEGQMLALDPPDRGGATVGGLIAAADSGPLRHGYGGPRDLVLGMTVALSDGTLAKSGGTVIKNVAGYDLAKLFTGSFGALGAIVRVAVRLHPIPPRTATAVGGGPDPDALGRAALALSHAPLELQSLDVRWAAGRGAVLARFAGAAPEARAESAAGTLREEGLTVELPGGDDGVWDTQRDGQRSADGTVLRVSGVQTGLPALLRAAERHAATVVGRAGLAVWWLRLDDRAPEEAAAAVEALRRELDPWPCALLDAPGEVRAAAGPGRSRDAGAEVLMRRLKERFDPAGTMA